MPEPAQLDTDTQTTQKEGQKREEPQAEESTAKQESASQKTILLVEDEPLLANLLDKRLTKEGFEVIRAEDGEEALEEIRKSSPNLVLLDIILPKVSGFEFMEKVQGDPHIDEVPIVVISNLGQESDIEKGEQLGAVGYFVKAQLSIEDLVNQVRNFLASRDQ